MNPDEDHEDHDEHNNILKYSQEHNNILKYFSLPRISSKSWWVLGHVAQDHWSLSNSYMSPKTLYIEIKGSALLAPLQSRKEKHLRSA